MISNKSSANKGKTYVKSKFTTSSKSISYKVVRKRCFIGLQL